MILYIRIIVIQASLADIIFFGPSYTDIRAPRQALDEGDLPPQVGAQTRPLTCSCQEYL